MSLMKWLNKPKSAESEIKTKKRPHASDEDYTNDSIECLAPEEKKIQHLPTSPAPGKACCKWRKVKKENLDLDYTILYPAQEAHSLFTRCEEELVYNVGDLAKVRIFGKWIDIPRKQVAHGDDGLTYTFSGNTVPARPWNPLLLEIRDYISQVSGYTFNFVLINRYENGHNYMGEHKDDEQDLCPHHPIASLSLGQPRDFIFKHQDTRGKNAKRQIKPISLVLENGSLLMMNAPTNKYWYHSLPKRTKAVNPRINFTFRKMNPSKCKPLPS